MSCRVRDSGTGTRDAMTESYASPAPCAHHRPGLAPRTVPTPKISVDIPCSNAAPYIGAALRSVLSQSDVELEVIVVDDGSRDGSADLVRREFPQVRLIEQANQGVAAARNAGINAASHDWIAFVDADDIWLAGKLAAQWQQLQQQVQQQAQQHPGTRMSYTAWHVWPCADAEPASALLEQLRGSAADAEQWAGASGWIYTDLLLDCVVWTSTVLVHRSVFDEVGVFDAQLRIGEDYDLWLRASRVTRIDRVASPLALYRMHPQSITKRVPEINHKGLVIARALTKWGYGAPDGSLARKADVNRGLARSWSDFAGAQLMAGDATRARAAALTALRVQPTHTLAWKVLIKSAWRSALPRSGASG